MPLHNNKGAEMQNHADTFAPSTNPIAMNMQIESAHNTDQPD